MQMLYKTHRCVNYVPLVPFQSATSLLLVDVGTEWRDFGLVLWADHDLLERESETVCYKSDKVASLELQMFFCVWSQLPMSSFFCFVC